MVVQPLLLPEDQSMAAGDYVEHVEPASRFNLSRYRPADDSGLEESRRIVEGASDFVVVP
jgi:hypothetical protein